MSTRAADRSPRHTPRQEQRRQALLAAARDDQVRIGRDLELVLSAGREPEGSARPH